LSKQLASTLPDLTVTCLARKTEVEIVDLDEVTTTDEVLMALRKAIHGDDAMLPEDENVKVTDLWKTRNGRQMATAVIPADSFGKLNHIRVGWLQCRVRPRRLEPSQCFRCHGFGHVARNCSGPDLS